MAETLRLEGRLFPKDVPALLPEQLQLLTAETMRQGEPVAFNPYDALAKLAMFRGKPVLAIDIGGDKISADVFSVESGGNLAARGLAKDYTVKAKNGDGFLEFCLKMAQFARDRKLPVGISAAGKVSGSCLTESPNVPVLMQGLEPWGGDLAQVFSGCQLALANDAVAGIKAGSVAVVNHGSEAEGFIYLINGGGIGGCVLKDKQIYPYEVGHAVLRPELNPYNQTRPCLFTPQDTHVCLERVGASGAGIEAIWAQFSGRRLSGKAISRFAQGLVRLSEAHRFSGSVYQRLAENLYETSAQIAAHAIVGMGSSLDLFGKETAIIGHGGGFKVPHYGERVTEIVSAHLGRKIPLFLTHDFYPNACLTGAAIGGLIQD